MKRIYQKVKQTVIYCSMPTFLIIIFGIFIYLNYTINPTGHSKEWLIHYKLENEDFLYIVNGRDIYDNSRYPYVKIKDTIELERSRIREFMNLELFGKDLEPDREKDNEEELHRDNYLNLKKRLKKKIPSSNIYDYTKSVE